jgi:hypothetical protein
MVTFNECLVLKEELAMDFWDRVRFKGSDPKKLPDMLSNLRCIGQPTNEQAIVVSRAINSLMSQILSYDLTVLAKIISTKKGRYTQSGFEIRQVRKKEWILSLEESEVQQGAYNPIIDLPVHERLDGMSILQLHALIAVLEVIPTFAKKQAA